MNLFNGRISRVEVVLVITELDGSQRWFLDGLLHREYAPAVTYPNGTQYWYLNGLRHRLDGPAVTYSDGSQQFWENGVQLDPAGQPS